MAKTVGGLRNLNAATARVNQNFDAFRERIKWYKELPDEKRDDLIAKATSLRDDTLASLHSAYDKGHDFERLNGAFSLPDRFVDKFVDNLLQMEEAARNIPGSSQ